MSELAGKKHADLEELVAAFLAHPTPDLKDVIIVHCSNLVEKIARRFAGIEPLDDLVQVGYVGLLNALSKFDPVAGVKFNTYATHLVAGEIKHYLRDRSLTIRHPAWLQELRHKVNKTSVMMQSELGRTPTPREIAERLQVSVSSIEEVFSTQDLLRVGSLDAPATEESPGEADVERIDASLVVGEETSVEDRVVLEQAMEQLRDLERDVLTLFHFEMLNQTEIAGRLGISCNYVSHILRQSLNKLRRILTNEEELERSLLMMGSYDSGNITDHETGLYTQAYFKSRLGEELHRVRSIGGSVGVVRVKFSGIRIAHDSFGAKTITEFIQDAAFFVREQTRSLDIVCRDGQFGMGVILPGAGDSCAVAADRLDLNLRKWMAHRVSTSSPLRFHLGHATGPEDGLSVKQLLAAAEARQQFDFAA
jgi:RNA polymerase sigma-B factor